MAVVSLDEGRQKHLLAGVSAPFAISPDSRLAATSGRDGMILFDLIAGQEVGVMKNVYDSPRSTMFSFSHDGRYFLGPHQEVGYQPNGVGVWSVSTGNLHTILDTPGWDQGITCLKIGCMDGWVFAAGNRDFDQGEVYLWHVESAKPVHVFKGLGMVFSIALFQQDRYLIASRDNQFRYWQLDWEHEFPELTGWDERANGYLDVFLEQNAGEISWSELSRTNSAKAQKQFTGLLEELGRRGYGWLRPEGVRKKLEEMAKRKR